MIHAYDEMYLDTSSEILGHGFDYALNTLKVSFDDLIKALSISDAGKLFCKGNPSYIAGMNGCEFIEEALDEVNIAYFEKKHVMYLERTKQFWAGYCLAYFQWYYNLSFIDIFSNISIQDILDMYPVYHEMDVMHFVEDLYEKLKENNLKTKLRLKRELSGMSQSELSIYSDVPIRQIQLFEQRQRDINKASVYTVYKLANALSCDIEDLIELLP